MATIHHFRHHAMATHFEVRLAGVDAKYAAQAALASFDLIDDLESRLSRFRPGSEVRRIEALQPGEAMRLSPAVFACLEIAWRMELATRGAFSATAAALPSQGAAPQWTLLPEKSSVRCDRGRVEFDLGAIGKGFALDRMAELLREWDWPAFLLNAGGSSILAGDAPSGRAGWSCGLGEDNASVRYWLTKVSLSGSGLAVKGKHIVDPRTGRSARRENRAWALCDSAAESDALSTACMVWAETERVEILAAEKSWRVFLEEGGGVRSFGNRPLPPLAL